MWSYDDRARSVRLACDIFTLFFIEREQSSSRFFFLLSSFFFLLLLYSFAAKKINIAHNVNLWHVLYLFCVLLLLFFIFLCAWLPLYVCYSIPPVKLKAAANSLPTRPTVRLWCRQRFIESFLLLSFFIDRIAFGRCAHLFYFIFFYFFFFCLDNVLHKLRLKQHTKENTNLPPTQHRVATAAAPTKMI